MSKEATEFMRKWQKYLSVNIHTSIAAKVISYDSDNLKASVQPVAKVDGENLPVLSNVPVLGMGNGNWAIHIPYEIGDLVYVSFSEHDLDNILLGSELTDVNTDRDHAFDDGIVMGHINPFTNSNGFLNNELLIKGKNGTSVKLNEAGDVIIEGLTIKLGATASEGVPLGDSLKSWLDTHTHGAGPVPDSASPSPSTKVKV